MKTHENIDGS